VVRIGGGKHTRSHFDEDKIYGNILPVTAWRVFRRFYIISNKEQKQRDAVRGASMAISISISSTVLAVVHPSKS
jgi:hypothetical protein